MSAWFDSSSLQRSVMELRLVIHMDLEAGRVGGRYGWEVCEGVVCAGGCGGVGEWSVWGAWG